MNITPTAAIDLKTRLFRMLTHASALAILLISFILYIGANIMALPIPPEWTKWWGALVILATGIKPFVLWAADYFDDGIINQSFKVGLALVLLCFMGATMCFMGCATNTADLKKNARGAATNTALIEAGKVIGQIGVATLMNYGKQEITDGAKADLGSAAAAGAWSTVDFSTVYNGMGKVILAYSNGLLPKTATAAAGIAKTALDQGQDPARVSSAIATVISTASGAPPKI